MGGPAARFQKLMVTEVPSLISQDERMTPLPRRFQIGLIMKEDCLFTENVRCGIM